MSNIEYATRLREYTRHPQPRHGHGLMASQMAVMCRHTIRHESTMSKASSAHALKHSLEFCVRFRARCEPELFVDGSL